MRMYDVIHRTCTNVIYAMVNWLILQLVLSPGAKERSEKWGDTKSHQASHDMVLNAYLQ